MQIAEKVISTDSLVADIATAAREQAQGIEQINTAIAQLDKVSQSNSASAEESASAAEELDAQAETLKDQVAKLRQLVGGNRWSALLRPLQRLLPKMIPATAGRRAIPMPGDPAPTAERTTTTSETSESSSGHALNEWMLFVTMSFSGKAYRILIDLIYEHSRIRLGADKQMLFANRLQKRLRVLGLKSYDDYCAVLQSPEGSEEIEVLVDLISTNHTKFFREPDHFSFLANRALPALIPRLVCLAFAAAGVVCGGLLRRRTLYDGHCGRRTLTRLSPTRVADHRFGYFQAHARRGTAGHLSEWMLSNLCRRNY